MTCDLGNVEHSRNIQRRVFYKGGIFKGECFTKEEYSKASVLQRRNIQRRVFYKGGIFLECFFSYSSNIFRVHYHTINASNSLSVS